MALVVVVSGPGEPAGSRSATGRSFGPLSVGPLSVGPALRRTDPAQRVVAALGSSLRAVRGPVPRAGDVVVLDFADLFADRRRGDGATTTDETARLAEDLLRGWSASASRIGRLEAHPERRRPKPMPVPQARGPAKPGDGQAPGGRFEAGPDGRPDYDVTLSRSPYFRSSAEVAIAEAQTLSRYLTELKLRHEVRDRALSAILPDTKVVIGHGLGALVAYEALCALSDAASVAFVSLGAAMCGPEQVFTRLEPAPRNGQGHWPAAIRRWCNVVSQSDPTAMIAPRLTERFGPGIEDEVIEIKSNCGEIQPYLLDRATGRALAAGLSA